MFKIIATEDFINVMLNIPIRFIDVLLKSFVSIEKVSDGEEISENSFLNDLLEQIKNQELE